MQLLNPDQKQKSEINYVSSYRRFIFHTIPISILFIGTGEYISVENVRRWYIVSSEFVSLL